MKHLTPDSWRRLRSGDISAPELTGLLTHLHESCEQCDAVVVEADEPALDCAIDAALARLDRSRPAPARMAALEQQVLRAVAPRRRRPSPWLVLVPLAAAAGAAFFAARPVLTATQGQQLKGEARNPSLTAVVGTAKGAPLQPLSARDVWPSTAELYFTYTLEADAYVYLGRVGVDGSVEPFYPPIGQAEALEAAGTRPLTVGGTVHAYSLQALGGPQRFVVLAAPRPLSRDELMRALAAGGPGTASFQIEVSGP